MCIRDRHSTVGLVPVRGRCYRRPLLATVGLRVLRTHPVPSLSTLVSLSYRTRVPVGLCYPTTRPLVLARASASTAPGSSPLASPCPPPAPHSHVTGMLLWHVTLGAMARHRCDYGTYPVWSCGMATISSCGASRISAYGT
eukprot:1415250-Rhodomonas_salina.2